MSSLSMGRLAVLEPGQRRHLPDTPPDLFSPTGTSFSESFPTSLDTARHRALPSPPMSSYENQPPSLHGYKGPDGLDRRPASGHGTPRQQLPSLSSLFGPPSSVRPLHSPMSERTGSYPMHSPLDRPRLSSSERQLNNNSYFPPTLSPPISQHRPSYDTKYESDRPSLHSMSRSASGPLSPAFGGDKTHSRSDSHHSEGRWWPASHDSERHEYSLDCRPRDQFRLCLPGSKGPVEYQLHRPGHTRTSLPSTPTGAILPEITVSKDGLGPKIWTGTHFLPRFVRAAEVPGEGMCYFYDDGSHCKTVIDGEVVNAHWGVTKAGKPRKRLAIACVTCREKKIKCDPDYPRCVQCEKFGRVCKFKNAPRGGHGGSPSTPPAELDGSHRLGANARPEEHTSPKSGASSPVSPRTTLRPQQSPDTSSKRLRIGQEGYVATHSPPTPERQVLDHSKSPSVTKRQIAEVSRISEDVLHRAWMTDPYASDPQSIDGVLSQFFAHVDSTMILQFLPAKTTKEWVSKAGKSPEDLMLLYSMLTVGVTLSGGPTSIAHEYAQVAHFAQKTSSVDCLQLVQSRILLAVHHISTSRNHEASEMMSAAAAATASLQLNLEFEQSSEAGRQIYPMGLSKAGYSEARRRTLWSIFILERLNGWYPRRLAMINTDDIYIRLPAEAASFEAQLESHAPFFDPNGVNVVRMLDNSYEIAAYLVGMVHIWAECQSLIYRMVHRPMPYDVESAKVQNLVDAMRRWHASLPTRLLSSRANLEATAMTGNIGSYLTMHLLYDHAMIRVHRYSRAPHQMPSEALRTHTLMCDEHGNRIVDMIESLDSLLRCRPMTLSVPPPIVAVAIAEAVDVLTASQALDRLSVFSNMVRMMKPLVITMGSVWEDSRAIHAALDQRLQLLRQVAKHPDIKHYGFEILPGEKNGEERRWVLTDPLEKMYGKDMDIIYSGLL